jgi:hypothetical protein
LKKWVSCTQDFVAQCSSLLQQMIVGNTDLIVKFSEHQLREPIAIFHVQKTNLWHTDFAFKCNVVLMLLPITCSGTMAVGWSDYDLHKISALLCNNNRGAKVWLCKH